MVGEAGDFKRLRDPPQALSFTEAGAFLLAHTAGYILGLVVPHMFAMPAGSSSPTMATTRAPCSTTSGTRTFNIRSGTPKWRPTASRTFGGTNSRRDRAAHSWDQAPDGDGTRFLGLRGPIAVSAASMTLFSRLALSSGTT